MTAAITSITGPTANGHKIERFLREKIRGGARRFELWHLDVSGDRGEGASSRVDGWTAVDGVSIAELTREIEDLAQGDATILGGVNAYELIALSDAGERLARTGLRVGAASPQDGRLAPSEKATLIGMRAQEMRHNEANALLATRGALDLIEAYRADREEERIEKRQLREEVAKAQEQRIKMVELYEKLLTDTAERELAKQRELRKDAAQQAVLDKLSTLWPILLHKLSGAGGAPEGQHRMMLETFLDAFTKEDAKRMAGALPLEKAILFYEILEPILKEREKERGGSAASGSNGAPPTNGAPPATTHGGAS
jgi:hypothetical protein